MLPGPTIITNHNSIDAIESEQKRVETNELNPGDFGEGRHLSGFAVYSADGAKVGTVGEVSLNPPGAPVGDRFYFRLEPSLRRSLHEARTIFIPARTISDADWESRRIVLAVVEERLGDDHWATPPVVTGHRDKCY